MAGPASSIWEEGQVVIDRRAFLGGTSATLAAIAAGASARPARAQSSSEPVPSGFTHLRVVEGSIDVEGKRGVAYRILLQDNGEQGYVGVRGGRFQVALENQTLEPTSIHWHGLILPNGQDGVPYVTQPPIKPAELKARTGGMASMPMGKTAGMPGMAKGKPGRPGGGACAPG